MFTPKAQQVALLKHKGLSNYTHDQLS